MTEKIKIGVILGGLSTENEVSLSSGRYVCMNIISPKYECVPIYFDKKARFWQIPQKLVIKNTTADIESRLRTDAKLIPYEELKNLIDFATMAEPLMKSSVPQVIQSLDDLEQNNVFKIADISIQTLKKIGKTYTEEEFQQIGDGLVRLTGLLRDLTSPESLDLLEKAARLPGAVDLDAAKPVGPFSMLGAMSDAKVKEGMGVLLELAKGLPAMKKS